ncbi:MAG: class I SAM-dependent methyltransferase [Phycisphaeraceae bacterium]|nr:class I SAM-dependent methyltransferase [Phycisphaeraceae bacterium]
MASDLDRLYSQYYSTARELEWYAICAEDKAQNIRDLCSAVPHSSIIEIGAGDGAILNLLDAQGFGERLHALEISESGLEAFGKKSWQRLVEVKRFDGYHAPYPDDAFDLAILSHVVEHVEHPRMLLYEAARIARHVFVEVPLECHSGNTHLRRDFVLDSTGHINFYNADLIRLLLQTSGLRVLDQKVSIQSPKVYAFASGAKGRVRHAIKSTLLRLAPRLAQRRFTYHCSVVCARATEGMGAKPVSG